MPQHWQHVCCFSRRLSGAGNRRKQETWLMGRGNVSSHSCFWSSSWSNVAMPPGSPLLSSLQSRQHILSSHLNLWSRGAPSPHSQWVCLFLKQTVLIRCLSSTHCHWGVTTTIQSWDIASSSNLWLFLEKYSFLIYLVSEIIKITSFFYLPCSFARPHAGSSQHQGLLPRRGTAVQVCARNSRLTPTSPLFFKHAL